MEIRNSPFKQFVRNVKILLYKSLKIQIVEKTSYILLYLSPLFILWVLIIYQHLVDSNYHWQKPNPQQYTLPQIPPCIGQDCKTLAYAIIGDKQDYMEYAINSVVKQNHIKQSQVVYWNKTASQIMKDLQKFPNKTQVVVIFCSSHWNVGNLSIPCYADHYHMNFYTILFNLSLFFRTPYLGNLKQSYPKDTMVMRLKQDIDKAIIQFYMKNNVTLKMTEFPSKNNRFFSGMNVTAQYGGFFFLLPYLILLVFQVSTLLKQKQNKLRIGLIVVGISSMQFYTSTIIISIINNSIITLNYCIFGYLLSFNFFTNSLIWFDFLLLCCNGILMSLIGMFIVSLVDEKKIGMSVTYAFVLFSIVIQWIFTGGFVIYFLYQKTNTTWINVVKIIFNLYPSFHYSKIYSDIQRDADSHFDSFQGRWISGNGFNSTSLYAVTKGIAVMPERQQYQIPSPFQSFENLLLTSFTYIILIWYFDNVVSSNRGKGQHPLFFLKKKYWQSVFSNKNIKSEEENPFRIEVRNAQKSYKKYPFLLESTEDVFALKGATFQIQSNQIVSLLGKNGAGKTTLIGILTGIVDLNGGAVTVCGLNVQTEMNSIRKRLGVCPQFEILWEQLTTYEHLKIFGTIKNISNLEQQIDKSLREVRLYRHKFGQIKTFSGGMKRRVSLAISFMGSPEVIILDEPTTGMDPKVRKETWNIIRKLKKNKSILITTHNMEEADCLSDRIMIMSSGKILAQGTSLSLKNEFGSGYKLQIITSEKQRLQQQLQSKGFKSEIIEDEVIIKSEKQNELISALQFLEKNKQGLVKQWLISESSLQQVFLCVNKRY